MLNGAEITLLFWTFGLKTVSILHLLVWEGEESVSYFGLLGLETVSILHLFVWEGEESVSYFGLLGLESESFSLFPHSFEWLPQKPHLSSTLGKRETLPTANSTAVQKLNNSGCQTVCPIKLKFKTYIPHLYSIIILKFHVD